MSITHKDCVKFDLLLKKHAIIIPLCGTKEYRNLVKSMYKKSINYSLTDVKKLLSYCSDRQHTTGHVHQTKRADKQYGKSGPLIRNSGDKSIKINRKLARRHKSNAFD